MPGAANPGNPLAKTVLQRWVSRFEAAMARLGHAFVRSWGRLERGYRRPGARFALRMKHEFYPLLAVIALAWLGWDWQHARSLDAAEDALFDKVIQLRPWERPPSGKVAIVEIDDCSLAHLRAPDHRPPGPASTAAATARWKPTRGDRRRSKSTAARRYSTSTAW